MSESNGDHEDPPTAPSEGGSAQNTPGVEVIDVTTGKSVAVSTPKLIYKIKGGKQEVYDVPSNTTKFVDDFVVPRVIGDKGLVRRRS